MYRVVSERPGISHTEGHAWRAGLVMSAGEKAVALGRVWRAASKHRLRKMQGATREVGEHERAGKGQPSQTDGAENLFLGSTPRRSLVT